MTTALRRFYVFTLISSVMLLQLMAIIVALVSVVDGSARVSLLACAATLATGAWWLYGEYRIEQLDAKAEVLRATLENLVGRPVETDGDVVIVDGVRVPPNRIREAVTRASHYHV